MAAVDEIAIKLGIKTGDLKAALLDAGADVKKFKKAGESTEDEGLLGQLKGIKKSLKDFGDIMAAGGIATAVQQFFSLAISRAQELKNELNDNARAVRGFADGLTEAKNTAGDFAVLVIGTFNRLGEAIGDTVNIVKSFVQNGTQGFEQWARVEDAVSATAAAAEVAERRLAEARKKNGAEFEAITREMQSTQEKSQELQLKGLTTLETQANIQAKLNQLVAEQALNTGNALERRRLALDIAKTQLALDETNLAVAKERAAEEKRLDEVAAERFFNAEEEATKMRQRQALDQKDELELFKLQQKNAAELTKDERARLEVLTLQRAEKAKQVEIEDLLKKKIEEGLTPAETKNLATLLKQTEEIGKQIAAKSALVGVVEDEEIPTEVEVTNQLRAQAQEIARQTTLAESFIAQWDGFTDKLESKGDVRELSDIQLAALKAKLGTQLTDRRAADRVIGGGVAGDYTSIEQSLFAANLKAVEVEQETRRQFLQTVQAFGEQYAERTFSPDEFNRLKQLLNPDVVLQQAKDISTMKLTLSTLFPKQAQGITPQ